MICVIRNTASEQIDFECKTLRLGGFGFQALDSRNLITEFWSDLKQGLFSNGTW